MSPFIISVQFASEKERKKGGGGGRSENSKHNAHQYSFMPFKRNDVGNGESQICTQYIIIQ